MIFVGGMVGWDARGHFPKGFAAQARQLSFLFLRVNRIPVGPIGFRNRFLTLAPTIA